MIIDIQQAQYRDIAPYLQAAVEYDTSGGAENVHDVAMDALLFKLVSEAHQVIGGYALRINSHQLRRVCWILAAAGNIPNANLTNTVMPAIADQARAAGASQLAIVTKRPGMVAKLQKLGFVATGIEMRKNLT